MAPFSGNGRRRRGSDVGANGSEVNQPVGIGGDEHVRIGGGEPPDGNH
jgi:hypothetical protein